jgi:hypothetical protein
VHELNQLIRHVLFVVLNACSLNAVKLTLLFHESLEHLHKLRFVLSLVLDVF